MTDKRLPVSSSEDERESDRLYHLQSEATQTIDLGGLFTHDVTSSGSFDIRGGIWASTFGKLLQSLPIPAFLLDLHHNIVVANEACARINSGYALHQGHPFTALFTNSSDAADAAELIKSVFLSRRRGSMQGKLQMGKGMIWARLTFRSIRIIDVRLVLVLVEDLTNERKLLLLGRKYQEELEKRVQERTTELTESNTRLQKEMKERKRAEAMLVQSERLRAVGEMSAGVAHNIKNLIQMIFGLTHAALNQLESDNLLGVQKELENIVESLQLGSETVRRLQDFARVGSKGSYEGGKVFDLSGLIRKAVEFTKPFWQTYPQSSGLRVDLNMELSDGCRVRGNQAQIFEVLVNLIKNAAEALIEGGKITLTASVDKGEVVFAVRDTGVGMRTEDMARLFTPFFTTKAEAGTGLGLATSRSIIESHGGTISVQSTCGKGTSFLVKLPLATIPPDEAEVPASVTTGRKLNILAVDDMDSNLMMVRLGLEAYHHTVLTALSGEEALEILRIHRVDLVLCDLAMPGMNGWEVGRRIRCLYEQKQAPRPPFILLTAWGHQSFDETKLAESGVEAVLEKPVDIMELIDTVEKVIDYSTSGR